MSIETKSLNTDELLVIAEQSEDALFEVYKEAIGKLRSPSTPQRDRFNYCRIVMTCRCYIRDKYCIKRGYHSIDNPMNNKSVARFFQ